MVRNLTRVAGLVLVSTFVLASCGDDGGGGGGGSADGGGDGGATTPAMQLFPDDFKPVCSGATQSRATDYATATTHKVVYFETYEDELVEQSSTLPSDWAVTFDANSDAYAAVDVVACAERTTEKLAQTCTGYEDDDTGMNGTVNWYTGTYELTAYEAKTGTELGTTTLEASDEECPMLASFDEGEEEIDMFDSPNSEDVVAFLKPFVQP